MFGMCNCWCWWWCQEQIAPPTRLICCNQEAIKDFHLSSGRYKYFSSSYPHLVCMSISENNINASCVVNLSLNVIFLFMFSTIHILREQCVRNITLRSVLVISFTLILQGSINRNLRSFQRGWVLNEHPWICNLHADWGGRASYLEFRGTGFWGGGLRNVSIDVESCAVIRGSGVENVLWILRTHWVIILKL